MRQKTERNTLVGTTILAEINGNLSSLSYGIAAFGPALGLGLIGAKTVESMARQPEIRGSLQTTMLIAMAFVENIALLAVVTGLLFS